MKPTLGSSKRMAGHLCAQNIQNFPQNFHLYHLFHKIRTLEEDLDLLESVIKTQKKIVSSVEGIEDDHVDWSSLAKHKNRFGERSTQNLREHWKRIIYPALIDESDIKERLTFRQKLLKRISKQGATTRNDIDWDKLQTKFNPKTKTCLVS